MALEAQLSRRLVPVRRRTLLPAPPYSVCQPTIAVALTVQIPPSLVPGFLVVVDTRSGPG